MTPPSFTSLLKMEIEDSNSLPASLPMPTVQVDIKEEKTTSKSGLWMLYCLLQEGKEN
jgi:hypothetical protein